jgi:septal ring factor EnvC (AmiA/AmiB activator)
VAALCAAALVAAVLAAAVPALAAAAPAPPQPPSPGAPAATAETRAREQELAALRAEISGLEARLEAARRQQSGAAGELAAADLALQLEEKRLAEAVAARDQAAERETASERQVAALERALDQRRRDFQRQLTGLYRLGRQGYLRLFFLLRPDASLLPSIRLMRYLVRRDREAVDGYQEAKQRLARRRDQLAAERQERDRWLGWEQTRRRELVTARQRKAALLARVERERRVLAGRAVELLPTASASWPLSSTCSTAAARPTSPGRRCSSSAASSTGRWRARWSSASGRGSIRATTPRCRTTASISRPPWAPR